MQKQGKAQATCVKVYTILQGIFKLAYLADLIDRNPMDKVERPKLRKDEMKKPTEAESYTAGELKYSGLFEGGATEMAGLHIPVD